MIGRNCKLEGVTYHMGSLISGDSSSGVQRKLLKNC